MLLDNFFIVTTILEQVHVHFNDLVTLKILRMWFATA